MVRKNFFFRENWIGSEVAGMKIAFFATFEPKLDLHSLRNSLNRILIFNPLERQKLYYY